LIWDITPDFEDVLLDLFSTYLAHEPNIPNYNQYRALLLKINPMEFSTSRNHFNAFKTRVKNLMSKRFPDVKISTSLDHPNYSTLYEYWRKLHKIFPYFKK
jgi:hypothetical protein